MSSFDYPTYPFVQSPDQEALEPVRHPVVIVGAGPVGLTAALDLADQGVPVVVLDDDDTVSYGSRAICWAKRTLEVWDRLGVVAPMMDKGVTWNLGKVYFGADQVYAFNLQPEGGQKFPAFINLQQYHVEYELVAHAQRVEGIDLRWKSKVIAISQDEDGVLLHVDTPNGVYKVTADWVIAADGVRSPVRRMMGLDFEGRIFEDRFLIADVRMKAEFPTERRFWFQPPFHSGASALLHRQADDIWRIDLQLGWDANPDEEKKPERVVPRLKEMLGEDTQFELEWTSVYTFQCRRMDRFRHGRVLFAGDSAHVVSPFGARGGNSGIQDIDNLDWKLTAVIEGEADPSLLDAYDSERTFASDENIGHSTRSTDFIAPKGPASRALRDAVLTLSARHDFARPMVNSGRLSTATNYPESPLNTPDSDAFAGEMRPGTAATNAPLRYQNGEIGYLLDGTGGKFAVLWFGDGAPPDLGLPTKPVSHESDPEGLAWARYDGEPGTAYLLRPDGHIAARFRNAQSAQIHVARDRALGKGTAA